MGSKSSGFRLSFVQIALICTFRSVPFLSNTSEPLLILWHSSKSSTMMWITAIYLFKFDAAMRALFILFAYLCAAIRAYDNLFLFILSVFLLILNLDVLFDEGLYLEQLLGGKEKRSSPNSPSRSVFRWYRSPASRNLNITTFSKMIDKLFDGSASSSTSSMTSRSNAVCRARTFPPSCRESILKSRNYGIHPRSSHQSSSRSI